LERQKATNCDNELAAFCRPQLPEFAAIGSHLGDGRRSPSIQNGTDGNHFPKRFGNDFPKDIPPLPPRRDSRALQAAQAPTLKPC